MERRVSDWDRERARELIGRWGRWRPLSDQEAAAAVEAWRKVLGVRQAVRVERISPYQVTDEVGRPGCSLVGVVYDALSACVYHTRALTAEDIVHELLHVARPTWGEAEVIQATNRLLLLVTEPLAGARRRSSQRRRLTPSVPFRPCRVGSAETLAS